MLWRLLRSVRNPAAPPPAARLAARLDALLEQKANACETANFAAERWTEGEDMLAVYEQKIAATTEADLQENAAAYEAAYRLFADQASRDLWLHLLAFRLLGHRRVRLPRNDPAFHEICARVRALPAGPSAFSGQFGALEHRTVEFAGERISLESWWGNVAWTFFIRQYYFERNGVAIAPRPGDRVIDAGACLADTALALAASVGPAGKVFSFEIDPTNVAVARHNLALNPRLAARIELRECALAHAVVPLYLHGTGSGARVGSVPTPHALEVTTIDRLVERGEAERIDFIKMDIEGAERLALQGAEAVLRRFRPDLALSVYHRVDDLRYMLAWLSSLGLGYRFYLEHYTIHHEETVLYATVRA